MSLMPVAGPILCGEFLKWNFSIGKLSAADFVGCNWSTGE